MVQRIFELVRERSDSLCNFIEIPLSELDSRSGYGSGSGNGSGSGGSVSRKGKGRARPSHLDVPDEEEPLQQQLQEPLRIIYRHYATLYFVFCVDEAESELGILDLIQVSLEGLVCVGVGWSGVERASTNKG